ncbi:MAG: hypothetical protein JXQ23_09455 [Clostridia bacterium]|nr:hypothetical protein [Clostridia bacterium]
MGKKILDRKASDNEYFHRDFHLSMNMLLDYILMRFGLESVKEYLTEYTKAYHQPLIQELKKGNLEALKEYIEEIYEKEKWPVNIEYSNDNLTFSIEACPGMSYIIDSHQTPSEAYIETYRTTYGAMCEDTTFHYEMNSFDQATGKSRHSFTRRDKS